MKGEASGQRKAMAKGKESEGLLKLQSWRKGKGDGKTNRECWDGKQTHKYSLPTRGEGRCIELRQGIAGQLA